MLLSSAKTPNWTDPAKPPSMAATIAGGDRFWRVFPAGGSILVFSFVYGRIYLEKQAQIRTKKMELELLKEESKRKDNEIALLEAAWEAELARRQALKVSGREE